MKWYEWLESKIDAKKESRVVAKPNKIQRLMQPNAIINESLQYLSIVLFVWALFQGFAWYWWALSYLMLVLHYGIGGAIGNHRYFCHESFKSPKWFEYVMLALSTLAANTAIFFTPTHLYHHAYVDTPKDPHSPKYMGWRAYFMWHYNVGEVSHFGFRKFLKMPHVMWAHNRKNILLAIWWAFWAWVSPVALLFVCVIPYAWVCIVLVQHVVDVHKYGYRNFDTDDDSRNCWWLLPLSFGEGWHNNHHKYPRRYQFGVKWWEIDPAAWVIDLVRIKDDTDKNIQQ